MEASELRGAWLHHLLARLARCGQAGRIGRAAGPLVRSVAVKGTMYITGDDEADELLNTDPLALLVGMMLDQLMQERRASPARGLSARLTRDILTA